ncbi:MAG: hypothetical protein ACK4JX_00785 [Flavobacterium sp.]
MKRKLDQHFKSQLQDWEVSPDPAIWQQLETKLAKKKKRRVIPLWWIPTGIAAGLLILWNILPTNDAIPTTPNSSGETPSEIIVVESESVNKEVETNEIDKVVDEMILKNPSIQQKTPKSSTKNEALVSSEKEQNNKYSNKKSDKNATKKDNLIDPINPTDILNSTQEKTLVQNNNTESTTQKMVDKNNPSLSQNKTTNTPNKGINTENSVAQTTPNPELERLEELLKEKEEITETNSMKSRWQLSSNVAPVFMNSLSQGSPIDQEFAQNSKSFETSMSYGFGVQYAVTNRWSVRTGIQNVQMSYNTNDVMFFASMRGVYYKNINYTMNIDQPSMVVMSKGSVVATSIENMSSMQAGVINQQFGFIEIPMEISYKLLDKKFQVSLIGGVSSLFLNQNRILLKSMEGGVTELGTANNIQDMHWSTNIGIGMQYLFSPQWSFQMEPMFKYQWNTFQENTNFRPYILGLQTGLSYRF